MNSKGHFSGDLDEEAAWIAHLVAGFIEHTLTESEHQELDDWVNESPANQRLFEELTDDDNLDRLVKWKRDIPTSTSKVLDRLEGRIDFTPKRKRSRVRMMLSVATAAAVIGGIIIGVVYYERSAPTPITPANVAIVPGGNKATLLLGNGAKIYLDNMHNGALANENRTQISKTDSGMILYSANDATEFSSTTIAYNTLETPPGGQYQLTLSDGTKAWLNAQSSIRYPVRFTGNARQVEITGEVYFEVAKNKDKPFSVDINNGSAITGRVEVLGTHFDINAYGDDSIIHTTLIEGSVLMSSTHDPGKLLTLMPGEQGMLSADAQISKTPADTENVLAWKNGQFGFKDATITEIMAQVSRWYSVKIHYGATVTDHFNASIPRDAPVEKLLHILEGTGRIHFKIEDHEITVMK